VIFLGTTLMCAIMYIIQGRKVYAGPVAIVERDL
jgi:hypothetical protein